MDNSAMDGINWQKVLELDVSFTVSTVSGGHFTRDMAEHIAKEDHACVKDATGKIVEDYRQ